MMEWKERDVASRRRWGAESRCLEAGGRGRSWFFFKEHPSHLGDLTVLWVGLVSSIVQVKKLRFSKLHNLSKVPQLNRGEIWGDLYISQDESATLILIFSGSLILILHYHSSPGGIRSEEGTALACTGAGSLGPRMGWGGIDETAPSLWS